MRSGIYAELVPEFSYRPIPSNLHLSTTCNYLSRPGGILTVADDLLKKNDGAKFLEMMEQLAARRMMREDMAIRDSRKRIWTRKKRRKMTKTMRTSG